MHPPIIICFLTAMLAATVPAHGQLPQVADARLGVDRVDLASGQRLYGFVLNSSADGLTVAVEREWLQNTHPELFEQLAARELADAADAKAELLKRIDKWMEERKDDGGFHRYLVSERERIEQLPTTAPDSLFMQLQLPSDQVRKSQLAAADRRHMAGIAYRHGLKNVVTTPTNALARQLEEAGVDAAKESVDLTDKLPALRRQSSQAWAARQAVVEHERLQDWVYQGTGNSFFKAGEAVDAAALIPQLLQNNSLDSISQLGAELGLPEFKQLAKSTQDKAEPWWQPVVRQAAAEGARGALITRLEQGLLSDRVRVASHFFARGEDSEWFEVVSFESQVAVGQADAEQLKQLERDPQVAQALSLLKGLGLAEDGRIQQALNHGAATQKALGEVSASFRRFADRLNRGLDGPVVPMAPAGSANGPVPR